MTRESKDLTYNNPEIDDDDDFQAETLFTGRGHVQMNLSSHKNSYWTAKEWSATRKSVQ